MLSNVTCYTIKLGHWQVKTKQTTSHDKNICHY